MCGEHAASDFSIALTRGSSPRVRGTPKEARDGPANRRIIPACAGNTLPTSQARRRHWDHPRVCGEHRVGTVQGIPIGGSSPRVRGTRLVSGVGRGGRGIIPACAGNTSRRDTATLACWDHPRVCGEHFSLSSLWSASTGSSPRVRGTLPWRGAWKAGVGIIPACAGNTMDSARL